MTDSATTADPLLALAERVEAGADMAPAISQASILLRVPSEAGGRVYDFWRVGAYLDAIASLQEAVLPGWWIRSGNRSAAEFYCFICRLDHEREGYGNAPTLRQAWLAALLRAVAMERRDG